MGRPQIPAALVAAAALAQGLTHAECPLCGRLIAFDDVEFLIHPRKCVADPVILAKRLGCEISK